MKLEQRYSELEASFECLTQERDNYRHAMHASEDAVSVFQRRVEILERLNHAYVLELADYARTVERLHNEITALKEEREENCLVHPEISRVCERGTKSCVIAHIQKHFTERGCGND